MTTTETKERPILFSAPMIRAILTGQKTQTRRVMKPQPAFNGETWAWEVKAPGDPCISVPKDSDQSLLMPKYCPYGQPGDVLWVRECFSVPWGRGLDEGRLPCWYWADGNVPTHGNWTRPKPSIHMPRWACRILLEIVGVRVERLQRIKPADVFAEGVGDFVVSSRDVAQELFARLWNGINEARGYGWEKNPWLWVIEFKRVSL